MYIWKGCHVARTQAEEIAPVTSANTAHGPVMVSGEESNPVPRRFSLYYVPFCWKWIDIKYFVLTV